MVKALLIIPKSKEHEHLIHEMKEDLEEQASHLGSDYPFNIKLKDV